jgi:hypothetical protein
MGYKVDQPAGAGVGVANTTYRNLWVGQVVNLTDPAAGADTYLWELKDKPGGSASVLTGASTATGVITPDVKGSYRFWLSRNGVLISRFVFRVSKDAAGVTIGRGYTLPAYDERLDEDSGGRGYAPEFELMVDDLEDNAFTGGGGTPAGNAPPLVGASTSVVGASTDYAREDHTHGQNAADAAMVRVVTWVTSDILPAYTTDGNVITFSATGVYAPNGTTNIALNDTLLVCVPVQSENPATVDQGWYKCTTAPAIGVAGVLTRMVNANTSEEIKSGQLTIVLNGEDITASTAGGTIWALVNDGAIVLNTTVLAFRCVGKLTAFGTISTEAINASGTVTAPSYYGVTDFNIRATATYAIKFNEAGTLLVSLEDVAGAAVFTAGAAEAGMSFNAPGAGQFLKFASHAGGGTYFDASNVIWRGSDAFTARTDAHVASGACSQTWAETVTGVSLGQATRTTDAACANTTIRSQAPWASAVTNVVPGILALEVPAPIGAIGGDKLQLRCAGQYGQIESWVAGAAQFIISNNIIYNNTAFITDTSYTVTLGRAGVDRTETVDAGATAVVRNQANRTTNSATGAKTTIRAQTCTGTTSIGGELELCSGSGTSTDGIISLKPGGGNVMIQCGEDTIGFFGNTPVLKPTGVPITAAGVHAALVDLGLIDP